MPRLDLFAFGAYVSGVSDASPRNRLAAEPSLYLRQHAGNPVDWYPWGAEALERARREDKPILLSIGYSACHWCHVMERESFENEAIARLMNEEFVCIKVDREERPDIDAVYMKTVQLMTGRGGWPMTLFLAPDLKPYYAGTYFPPEDRGGMPGFARVLAACARAYRDEGERVAENGARVLEALSKAGAADATAIAASEDTFEEIADALGGVMDAAYGGFGQAPKFPQSLCLSLLMAIERRRPSARRHELLTTTLDRMADGGIYDHLGGGFHRYSVDRYWLVPHFEKMLYDQALLADLYGEAWRLFGEDRYAETAAGILDYVHREMTSEEGAFYSTQDADSEGVEGKFYVWTPAEIAEALGGKDVELVCRFFDVSEEGNFEGRSILRRTLDFEEAARMFGREAAGVERAVTEAKAKLYQWRKQRVPPATDRKILTDWNGLMIGAMARTGRLLGRSDLVAAAAAAADAVRGLLWCDSLLHLYGESEARVGAFLDDFAFFGRGCLELYLAAGRSEDLASARRAADELIERFEAPESGGFYFSASDAEAILVRSRDLYDGAVPAGNSVAVDLLLRLYQLTGHDPYRRAGEAALKAFLGGALANPYGGGHLLSVAVGRQIGLTTVVIAAGSDAAAEKQLTRAALAAAGPETAVLVVGDGGAQGLPEVARAKAACGGRATAYLCQGRACSAPILQAEELSRRLTSAAPVG